MSYPKATTGDQHQVPAGLKLSELEERVLAYWKADDTFRASIAQRPAGENGANEFVVYDGPPFANGLPHYGHLLTGYVKDVVPRFQTMRGRRVERRFGWDTHGLPAELEAMNQLGLKTRDEILELGIEKFNAATRESVFRYTEEWVRYVTRQARWVDFDDDYKTLDLGYMESVLWAFKSLYDKGLVYQGLRVLPYCWNDETPLSAHELRMDDDVYQDREDPSVTVGLRLETGELALIWTTTPWTLPANLAIMVNPGIDYVVVESEVSGTTERYVIAEALLASYPELGPDAPERIVQGLKGSELVGRSYLPPFDYYLGHPGAHRVVAADFVTVGEGTGLVHNAGAFGEEDMQVTDAEGIEPVIPVDAGGRFTAPVEEYAGLQVFDANLQIVDHLRDGGGRVSPGTMLLRSVPYLHSYPHCWRCRNPLIYKAVSSWFVAVTKIRDRMVELNQQITWVPEHIKDGQFGNWLAGARDWSISRNRFWGSPIPIWSSDDPAHPRLDVYGSVAELEADFGVPVTDLHRPYVDQLTRPNPDDPTGRSTMRRVPDVLDVWFDSGSMPFAQVHYPQHNADWFEHHYPGDFIVEYIGQTRGWFYTMHVLATALFDRPAFSNCISHGIVLGDDGQKMSKSLRNYPDIWQVFDRDGADAMRWFLMSSPILRGGDLIVTEPAIREGVRQVIIPLWNTWHFFALYAGAARGGRGYDAKIIGAADHVLDRFILARTRRFVGEVGDRLAGLEIAGACDAVLEFLDTLSNWYIRRSRERFWDGESGQALAAFDTLFTVLETTARTVAPLLPLVAEEIWRGLTGGRSVHLTDWPDQDRLPADDDLVRAMDRTREVCSTGSALRKRAGLRVRLPLSRLTIVTDDAAALRELTGLIGEELNVREVVLTELAAIDPAALGVHRELRVDARAAGPRLGRDVQTVIKASKAGDWTIDDHGAVTAAGIALLPGEFTVQSVIDPAAAGDHREVAMLPGVGFLILDTEVTADLAAEGLARDVIRAVQQARRDAGLAITDRIDLTLAGDHAVQSAVQAHQDLITAETLTERLRLTGTVGDRSVEVGEVHRVEVTLMAMTSMQQ
ncbi:isoleucine--tRNA ligase [Microlunatus speluncae]|uniref:isoleucine--tRNA ligase n=1 Tax=Microlunatus speluncae TaxID=2594267 RepID=UPI0012667DE1|nr:isoleucine--tRNA ligase [Microlunatus speluncae]